MTHRIDPEAARDAHLFPDGLSGPEEPVFTAPWQARAFALTVQLNDSGLLPWSTWAEVFSRHLGQVQSHGQNPVEAGDDSYYRAWLSALQEVLQSLGIVGDDEVESVAEAWQTAARATPHGKPIELYCRRPSGTG